MSQYGICLNYKFTKAGKEAIERGIIWQELLKPKYSGVYYWLQIETSEERYEPLLHKMKKDFKKDQTFGRASKDLEDIVEPKRRYTTTEKRVSPRNKLWKSHKL